MAKQKSSHVTKSPAETEFWTQVAEASNPGWSMHVVSDPESGSPGISGVDVHIYIVDTSTLWIAAAGLREQEAIDAIRNLPSMAKNVAEMIDGFTGAERSGGPMTRDLDSASIIAAAGMAITNASDSRATANSPELGAAFTLSWLAISLTKTFEQAKKVTGVPNGHWLYLLYRTAAGTSIARPAYAGRGAAAGSNGLLAPKLLAGLVRQVVQVDLGNPGGVVFGKIKADGGAKLAPELGIDAAH